MGLAEGPKDFDPASGRQRRGFPGHPALADARRSHHIHHTTAATDRAVHHGVQGRHLPASTDQACFGAPGQAIPRADPHQPARGNRFVGPLDAHPFRFGQHHGVLDEPRGRLREHHPARGRHRFHPLGEPDRLADRGVAQRPRTDLTGDHPTRIQSHPQLQSHAIAAGHLGREPVRHLLDGQRSQTCSKSMILQRNWGAEQRHHSVTRVFHGPAAVALHHLRRPLHQLGHDLTQPLRIQAAAMSIERTTSANSTVTCLYSAASSRPSALTRTRRRIGRPRGASHHTTGTLPALPSPHPPRSGGPDRLPDPLRVWLLGLEPRRFAPAGHTKSPRRIRRARLQVP